MRLFFKISLVIVSTILLAACSKKESENRTGYEQAALDKWMEQNRAEGLNDGTIERLENGMYIQWLRPSEASARKADYGDWLMLNYRGALLDGSVFVTRYMDEAKKEGTFSSYVHYVPDYQLYSSGIDFTEGERIALSMMVENDSVRLYLPPALAYGDGTSNFSEPYLFSGSVRYISNRKNVIIDLVLKKIIADETTYEKDLVVSKAAEWNIIETDSLAYGLYIDLMETDASEPLVKADSTVYLYYTGRFLDGFLYQSNVSETIEEEREVSASYSPVGFVVKSSASADFPVSPVVKALSSDMVRHNSTFRIVYMSQWGYGAYGNYATATRPHVPPYTPLMYEFTVMPKDYDPSEE